jgi:hypothetical protein
MSFLNTIHMIVLILCVQAAGQATKYQPPNIPDFDGARNNTSSITWPKATQFTCWTIDIDISCRTCAHHNESILQSSSCYPSFPSPSCISSTLSFIIRCSPPSVSRWVSGQQVWKNSVVKVLDHITCLQFPYNDNFKSLIYVLILYNFD